MGIIATAIAKKIIEKSVNIETNEASISIWVRMAKIRAPMLNIILNSYFEKIKIRMRISKKLTQEGITLKKIYNPIKTTFLNLQKESKPVCSFFSTSNFSSGLKIIS